MDAGRSPVVTRSPVPSDQRDETLSPGRALALVLAAVAISVAMSLLVTRWGSAETAAPAAPAGTSTDPAPVTVAPVDTRGESVVAAIVPKAALAPAPADEINVAMAPAMPPAATRTTPAIVDVTFEVVEGVSTIDPTKGTRTETWGYRLLDGPDGLVVGTPGPVIRARVGDVLRFTIVNPAGNTNPHNVDLHAVTGQGGGAEATTVAPGETRTIEARLLYPGFFMYHCAYGDVPAHISHGMFGGILVDPEVPLPDVDHEWYIVQSEYYLADDDGDEVRTLDRAALTAEAPTHVVFNGSVGALTGDGALQMAVGERARIYFVNAGLNLISSFHPIGSHWDAVYPEAALLNPPLRGSQTTLVPAGGGTVVELVGQVPSTIVLVDHALTRTFDKGSAGLIVITGDAVPEIFEEVEPGVVERPDVAKPPSTDETVTATGAVLDLAILAGSGDPQALDAADEFAADEAPADYSANVFEVSVGDTIRWTNDDALFHSVTAVDGSFDSGLFATGETFSWTFTEAGEFEYYCIPHPWMRARVVVVP